MTVRLVKLTFSIAVWVYSEIRKFLFRFCGKTVAGTCVVLYYHMVGHEEGQKFARQLDDILRHAEPIRADAKITLRGNTHYVVVTFDDGFSDILENAGPELEKRKIPFTIFVPTGYLGKKAGWVKNRGRKGYQETIINEAQLRGICKSEIVSIGSHCVSHTDLRLVDEDSARDEIFRSKNDLEDITGRKVTLLSFPHGGYTKRYIDFVRQAGYERVFTIRPTAALLSPDEFLTGRVGVDPGDWRLEFRLKMLGAYGWISRAIEIKRRILGDVLRWRGFF